jgi:hypothetical protein
MDRVVISCTFFSCLKADTILKFDKILRNGYILYIIVSCKRLQFASTITNNGTHVKRKSLYKSPHRKNQIFYQVIRRGCAWTGIRSLSPR